MQTAKYKLAIVGSRTFNNYELLRQVLNPAADMISEVISGGATGADKLAERWSLENSIPCQVIRPDWRPNGIYDKGAGFKRNILIVQACDKLLCLWDGVSRGCINSVDHCVRLQKPYHVITAAPIPESIAEEDDIPW
jgi:hypothetical protein